MRRFELNSNNGDSTPKGNPSGLKAKTIAGETIAGEGTLEISEDVLRESPGESPADGNSGSPATTPSNASGSDESVHQDASAPRVSAPHPRSSDDELVTEPTTAAVAKKDTPTKELMRNLGAKSSQLSQGETSLLKMIQEGEEEEEYELAQSPEQYTRGSARDKQSIESSPFESGRFLKESGRNSRKLSEKLKRSERVVEILNDELSSKKEEQSALYSDLAKAKAEQRKLEALLKQVSEETAEFVTLQKAQISQSSEDQEKLKTAQQKLNDLECEKKLAEKAASDIAELNDKLSTNIALMEDSLKYEKAQYFAKIDSLTKYLESLEGAKELNVRLSQENAMLKERVSNLSIENQSLILDSRSKVIVTKGPSPKSVSLASSLSPSAASSSQSNFDQSTESSLRAALESLKKALKNDGLDNTTNSEIEKISSAIRDRGKLNDALEAINSLKRGRKNKSINSSIYKLTEKGVSKRNYDFFTKGFKRIRKTLPRSSASHRYIRTKHTS